MTGNTRNNTLRLIGLFAMLLILAGTNAFALQEEKISTLSDYLYKKDYKRYEEIKTVTDCQKKIDQITALLKERPITRVLLYAASDYMACIGKIAGGNPDKIISMTEALQALVPTDQQIAAEAKDIPVGLDDFKKDHLKPTRQMILRGLAGAYLEKKDYEKAAELAEKAYALGPDKQLTQILYSIYAQLKNDDKILFYGKKMLASFPMKDQQGYGTALTLADIYLKRGDLKNATSLFSKLMDAYGTSVPPNFQEEDWNKVRATAYDYMGREAVSQKNYAKAEQLLQKSLTFDSRNDAPYYFLGMCRWNAKDQKGAIVYFARCYVLNKGLAAKAKGYLEQLHKAEYPNAPAGALDEVIAQARKDLGI